MLKHIAAGIAAGAIGTVALNVSTYVDMAVRGRPSSQVPAKVAGKIAEGAGVRLAPPGQERGGEKAQHRREGLGALMGYGVGIGVGAAFGVMHGLLDDAPLPLASAALGAAAMAASDVPAMKTGVTDPRQWPASSWVSDIVPHLLYGLFTVAAFRALTDR